VVEIDGKDHGHVLAAYTLHHEVRQVPELVVRLAAHRSGIDFDGFARVVVGVPPDPGPVAAAFLGAIDAGELEMAALARADLSGGQHGFMAAVLRQLQEWARGEYGPFEKESA
jgi:hypothetical protein